MISSPLAPRLPRRAALAALVLSAPACSRSAEPADGGPIGPLTSIAGDTASVALDTRVLPLRAERLPSLTFAGGRGSATVVWEVRSGPCMIATAQARRSEGELVLWIERGGDPAALCAAGEVVYRYEAHVSGMPAGRYRVRVVEQPVEQRAHEVGAGEVVVTGG
jgi:hypothetical protein